jgi:hypothetical protein
MLSSSLPEMAQTRRVSPETRDRMPGSSLDPRSVACRGGKTSATAAAATQKRYFRPLPKEFRRDGFSYRQIAREGDAAIYVQTWTGCPDPAICFEVIRVKRRQGFEIDGRFVPAGETCPASKLWGTDGFTLTDKDAAFTKLREIVASPDALGPFKQKEAGRTEKSPT